MKASVKSIIILAAAACLLQSCAGILVSTTLEKELPARSEGFDEHFRDTFVVIGGKNLHAYYSPALQPSARTAIVVHGYTSRPEHMLMIAKMFRDSLGYNVWMPALQHHDGSEGKAIQMGWLDRLDVLEWSKIAHEHFQDTLQVVHGISMGGATTMMVSGEQTPAYMKGFIEDCGYTSVWEQFAYIMKIKYPFLRERPTLYHAERIVKRRYGWDFHEASSTEQLGKCEKPMLFIHGDADDFVPTYMVYQNFEAKTSGYRELWIAKGAKHARAFSKHSAEYTAVVRKFLAEHVE